MTQQDVKLLRDVMNELFYFVTGEIEEGDWVLYEDARSGKDGKKHITLKVPLIGIWENGFVQFKDDQKTLVRNKNLCKKLKIKEEFKLVKSAKHFQEKLKKASSSLADIILSNEYIFWVDDKVKDIIEFEEFEEMFFKLQDWNLKLFARIYDPKEIDE